MDETQLANVQAVCPIFSSTLYNEIQFKCAAWRQKGLRIVHKFSELLKAKVTVESRPQDPHLPKDQREFVTTFTIRLPVVPVGSLALHQEMWDMARRAMYIGRIRYRPISVQNRTQDLLDKLYREGKVRKIYFGYRFERTSRVLSNLPRMKIMLS